MLLLTLRWAGHMENPLIGVIKEEARSGKAAASMSQIFAVGAARYCYNGVVWGRHTWPCGCQQALHAELQESHAARDCCL